MTPETLACNLTFITFRRLRSFLQIQSLLALMYLLPDEFSLILITRFLSWLFPCQINDRLLTILLNIIMQLTSLAFLLRRHVHICFGLWHGIFAANLSVMVFMLRLPKKRRLAGFGCDVNALYYKINMQYYFFRLQ